MINCVAVLIKLLPISMKNIDQTNPIKYNFLILMFRVQLLTCFEDLVAQREARPLVGVVRYELDVERGPRRYDWRRGDVAAVLPEEVGRLRVPIVDLHIVIPAEDTQTLLNTFSPTYVVVNI